MQSVENTVRESGGLGDLLSSWMQGENTEKGRTKECWVWLDVVMVVGPREEVFLVTIGMDI